jgi:hypothetical protein
MLLKRLAISVNTANSESNCSIGDLEKMVKNAFEEIGNLKTAKEGMEQIG